LGGIGGGPGLVEESKDSGYEGRGRKSTTPWVEVSGLWRGKKHRRGEGHKKVGDDRGKDKKTVETRGQIRQHRKSA